jgi:hypothetical protein
VQGTIDLKRLFHFLDVIQTPAKGDVFASWKVGKAIRIEMLVLSRGVGLIAMSLQ